MGESENGYDVKGVMYRVDHCCLQFSSSSFFDEARDREARVLRAGDSSSSLILAAFFSSLTCVFGASGAFCVAPPINA